MDKIITGTPRPTIYCKICKKEFMDLCFEHCSVPNSWELRYG